MSVEDSNDQMECDVATDWIYSQGRSKCIELLGGRFGPPRADCK